MWWWIEGHGSAKRRAPEKAALSGLILVALGLLILALPEILVFLAASIPLSLGVWFLVRAYREYRAERSDGNRRVGGSGCDWR